MVHKRMGSKSLTPSVRYSIASLARHSRFSKERIAKIYNVSPRTVYALLKRLATRGTLEDAPRSGRRHVTNQVEDRRLERMARRNPFRGSKAIQVAAHLPCSAVTVRRRLREVGLPRRVARHKPLLNDRHREVRLAWCRERTNLTVDDWASTIFSDERTFRLGKYGRVCIPSSRPSIPSKVCRPI